MNLENHLQSFSAEAEQAAAEFNTKSSEKSHDYDKHLEEIKAETAQEFLKSRDAKELDAIKESIRQDIAAEGVNNEDEIEKELEVRLQNPQQITNAQIKLKVAEIREHQQVGGHQ